MKSIKNDVKSEIIINKSRFINFLMRVENVNQVNLNINNIKKKYKNATHYCFAYIINDLKKTYDDNEPCGTAGIPILNVLENKKLNYILCVVVRYFGGIKLGSGGLIRAYTKSVTSCLKTAEIEEIKQNYTINIVFIYENIKIIEKILKDYVIIKKNFNQKIIYEVIIEKKDYQNIINKLDGFCENIKIIK